MKMGQKRYRILYVEKPTETVGGSVISLYELVRGLDTTRYEPVVLFYGPSAYRGRFQALGVKVLVLNDRQPPLPPPAQDSRRDIETRLSRYGNWLADGYKTIKQLYKMARVDWPLARRVARIIKEEKIDLVHHNNTLTANRATIIAARLAGVPQVCHVRMLHPFSPLERWLGSFVTTFIYNSRAVEDLYRRLGIPAAQGQVVYNPVDVETYKATNHLAELRAEFGLSDGDRLVSNVGRLSWWKGQDYFLEAIAQTVRQMPNIKALVVGGPGFEARDQAYYQRLQQLLIELGLSGHVIFTGFRADVPRIMAASDVVVHSSSEPEPFGRVVIEGMAAGRPVVATAAGGVLEIIQDGITGLLVPPKNACLMAQAIQKLLQNPTEAYRIGQCAQQYVENHFSVERHVTAIQQIYQQALTF